MSGWIKLWRELSEHWIYKDAEYLKVWVEMLIRARYLTEPKTKLDNGIQYKINYAQFVYGRKNWSKRLGISEQRLRGLFNKLLKDGMIKVIKHLPRLTLVEVVNYEKFNHQDNHQQDIDICDVHDNGNHHNNHQVTTTQPPSNHQVTTEEERKKDNKEKKKDIYTQERIEIIDYLNLKTSTKYRHNSDVTKKHISARLNEDFTVDDFKKVIDIKVIEWTGTEQEKFLRPQTLFGSYFEGYLNQKGNKTKKYDWSDFNGKEKN